MDCRCEISCTVSTRRSRTYQSRFDSTISEKYFVTSFYYINLLFFLIAGNVCSRFLSMYDPTSLDYWEGCLQKQIIYYRVQNNTMVKPLLFLTFDKCIQNLQVNIYFSLKSVPTKVLNMLVNRSLRYGIDFSRLLYALSGSNLTRLDVTNFGVGHELPSYFFKDLSACYKLVHLDLYGFEFDVSELGGMLKSLVNMENLYLGCDQRHYTLSKKLICNMLHLKLSSLHLRNFTIDVSSLSSFPLLVSLDLSCCKISEMSKPIFPPPPLKHISVSKPTTEQLSSKALDFSLYASTLVTLRISFVSLVSSDLFGSHSYLNLSELEIIYSKFDEYSWFVNLAQILNKFCPNLSRLIYLSPTDNEEIEYGIMMHDIDTNGTIPLDFISPSASFSFEFISHHSSPPVLMELILNHFHHPEVAARLANMKNSSNTFFWSRGRMGSRARVSPHFLVLAYVLFLNPKRIVENTILLERLSISRHTCDLEIICGEDYIIPLVHLLKCKGNPNKSALEYVRVAQKMGFIATERLKGIVHEL